MNRQKQRCPYCGKSMGYVSAYASRRKAEYVCPHCGKESRVVISKLIIPIFVIAAGIALAIMVLALSPKFVCLEPLKKYQTSMEARKAGMEYSDNLSGLDFDDDPSSPENGQHFKLNSDLFNQIKSSRSSSKEQAEGKEIVSNSQAVQNDEPVTEPAETPVSDKKAEPKHYSVDRRS